MAFFDKLNEITKELADADEEQRLISESIMEALTDGIFVIDSRGKILMVNKAVSSITGYELDELLGKNIDMLIPDCRKERHKAELLAYVKNPIGRPMNEGRELLLAKKDGRQVYVVIALNPVQMRGSKCTIAVVRLNPPHGT